MGLAERLAKASDRMYDRMRSPQAVDIAAGPATGSIRDLDGRKYCVLVTYRKNGEAMPSPLWFGTGNGKLYFLTGATTAKLKRIRNNPEVLVAPATTRGKPLGPPFAGRARVLPPEEVPEAERWLQANYGLGRRIYSLFGRNVPTSYVEVTPNG
jgi:PPOX class probable F420-dependent enzyme